VKRIVLTCVAVSALIVTAHAGCSTSGIDGPLADAPKVVVCLMNKCEETIELTVCSTGPGGSWITYGNGVTVTADGKGRTIAIHQGDHLVPRSRWKTLVIKERP
jgi:hypothetical protein